MQRFINPYHFISLSDQPERRQESEGEKLTGSVTYRLRTRSELFIPNTSSSRAFSILRIHRMTRAMSINGMIFSPVRFWMKREPMMTNILSR